MIKDLFGALGVATLKLFRNWTALLILLILYLAMLGCFYLFIATREATIAQLALTTALVIVAPVLCLVIQTIAVRYTGEERAGKLLAGSFRDFWKLAAIVLPVVILIGLAVYYLGSIEIKSVQETVRTAAASRRPPAPKPLASTPWQTVALTTLQYLLLGLLLPLASIHLWIDTARNGLKSAFKSAVRTLAHAFAPRAVLVYVIGFVVFAVVPYLLVFKRTPISSPWLEVSVLAARLALAVLFSLVGWVVTVGALTLLHQRGTAPAAEKKAEFGKGPEHAPARS